MKNSLLVSCLFSQSSLLLGHPQNALHIKGLLVYEGEYKHMTTAGKAMPGKYFTIAKESEYYLIIPWGKELSRIQKRVLFKQLNVQ